MAKVQNTSGRALSVPYNVTGEPKARRCTLAVGETSDEIPDALATTLVDVLGCTLVSTETDEDRAKAAEAAAKADAKPERPRAAKKAG